MTHRTQITASIKKYMDKARELYPNADLPDPTISFNLKGGTVLGQARYGARHFMIRINDLVSKKYLDDAINDTAPHEVAHLVAYKVYGRCQGHGPNWQRIMRQFGLTPTTKADASIDTLEFKIFKSKLEHVYYCSDRDCTHGMGTARHNKLTRGATYICRKTGGHITRDNYVRSVRKSAAEMKAEAYRKAGKPLPGATPKAPRTPRVAPRPAMAAKTAKSPNRPTGTKKERSETLYLMYMGRDRQVIIDTFMTQLDMTAAGAATYYANCKKKFG